MKRFLFLFVVFLTLSTPFRGLAQGGELLIQQYNRGPQLDRNYSKWSFKIGPQLSRLNTDLGTSSPTITLGGLFEIEYRLSKTVGLKTGSHYVPVSYTYAVNDSTGQDFLKYVSFPIILKLQPTNKMSFGLGVLYHYFLKGEKRVSKEEVEIKTAYPEGVFENSFGGIAQINYFLHPRISVFGNFRWVKKINLPTNPKTNTTSGFQLGMSYLFLKSRERP